MGDVISIHTKRKTSIQSEDREYNGHPSWEHWNVTLWAYNDECFYGLIVQAMKDERNDVEKAARRSLRLLQGMNLYATPDGAAFTEELLAYALEDLA